MNMPSEVSKRLRASCEVQIEKLHIALGRLPEPDHVARATALGLRVYGHDTVRCRPLLQMRDPLPKEGQVARRLPLFDEVVEPLIETAGEALRFKDSRVKQIAAP